MQLIHRKLSSFSSQALLACVFICALIGKIAYAHDGKDPSHQHPTENVIQSEEQMAEVLENAAKDASKIGIVFDSKAISVEFADEQEERALGLMYRRSLCSDCGMLFEFDAAQIASIWMKNTYIPLDLAYISEDGTIVEIHQLEPFNLEPVPSSKKVLYALEMNLGWFAKNNIHAGSKVKIQSKHPL